MNLHLCRRYGAAQLSCLFFFVGSLAAQVPQLIPHQGRIVVGALNFTGTGQFKFALVNGNGTTTYWSNDGSSTAGGEPTNPVAITVTRGLYSVLLGDTSLTHMTAIPSSVFNNSDVRLRVWFNDGSNGSQVMSPDQRIAAVGYAMVAGQVSGTHAGTSLAADLEEEAQIRNTTVTNDASFSALLVSSGTNSAAWQVIGGDLAISGSNAFIAANAVALGTDTTGGYVASVATGNGLTGGAAGSEGAALTLGLDYTATLGTNSLAADRAQLASTGLLFEGSSSDANEGILVAQNPTADRTWTLPDASGTVVTSGNLSAITSVGTLSSMTVSGAITTGSGSVALTNANGTIRNAALEAPKSLTVLTAYAANIGSNQPGVEFFEFVLPFNTTVSQVQIYCTAVTSSATVQVLSNSFAVTGVTNPSAGNVVTPGLIQTEFSAGGSLKCIAETNGTGSISGLHVTLVLKFAHQP